MPDEYGATPNYSLRFPTDGAPIDTAGDIQRLAEDVDGALGGVKPLSDRFIYGAGRPDTDPQYADAPIGTRYICTAPDSDTNLGAREWIYVKYSESLSRWEVTAGVYRWVVPQEHLGENWVGKGDGSQNSVTVSPNQVTVTGWCMTTNDGADDGSPNVFLFNPSNGNSVYNYSAYWAFLGVASETQFSAGIRHNRLAVSTPTRSSEVPSGTFMGCWTYTKAAPGTWPTQKELTVAPSEFRAHIKQAIEDNPEMADQLRQELSEWEAERRDELERLRSKDA